MQGANLTGEAVMADAPNQAAGPVSAYHSGLFLPEPRMLDINPVAYKISDLKGRVESLRGYL